MQVALIQLSDIHLSPASTEINSKSEKLADAIASAAANCFAAVIILSGDVANTGQAEDYEIAQTFFAGLKAAVTNRKPDLELHFISVPGNHDCFLPKEEEALRRALCDAINPTFQTSKPDAAILSELLQKQDEYFAFSNRLFGLPTSVEDKVCMRHMLTVGQHKLTFNLFNSAICSQRDEQQKLVLPMELIRNALKSETESDIQISVCHHPYWWLQADVSIAFRDFLEQTSDLVFTGHQHRQDSYTNLREAGETIFYCEGAVLQELGSPRTSAFNAIVLDLEKKKRQYLNYQWSKTHYEPPQHCPWIQYNRSPTRSSVPAPLPEFFSRLTDPGIGLTHLSKGAIPLDMVFVYPDASFRSSRSVNIEKSVAGADLLEKLTVSNKVLLNGAPYSGKTALLKTIAKDWLRCGMFFPLFLTGHDFASSSEHSFEHLVDSAISRSYGPSNVTKYKQLKTPQKVLMIDDWDLSPLELGAREVILRQANSLFGKVIVCTQGAPYLRQLLEKLKKNDVMADYDIITIKPLSHVSRGNLIEKWLVIDLPKDSPEFPRRVEETERTIRTVIGKNTLPSLPFIVLAILQAIQRDQDALPENGSFGYLYEVLITTALSNTLDNKPQLDKKYTFLSHFAYYLFKHSLDRLDVTSVKVLLSGYAKNYRIVIDQTALLKDLEHARILSRQSGNYSFVYSHYYFYFLARYFKFNLAGGEGDELRKTLHNLARGLNVRSNGIFLMFVIYLTHDEQLTDMLVKIGDEIFSEEPESRFMDDVDVFNNGDYEGLERHIPAKVDVEKTRHYRREAADRTDAAKNVLEHDPQLELITGSHGYSTVLPMETKLTYAIECLQILGQILRNFTGSLPGDRKLDILSTTYRLGLRMLNALLALLREAVVNLRKTLVNDADTPKELSVALNQFDRLATLVAQLAGYGMLRVISNNIGSAEIEPQAYSETQDRIGKTNATELIDLAIKLDHLSDYPFAQIKRLAATVDDNLFAKLCLQTW